ncbi:hypothetical protein ABID58_007430 [Bradyrhizobium sp. S3.2.6]|uniref:hypothetical protein n=1 Tax=Bradyrhizobium sp. S3.2.6 TaxID=3156428 RepID=UPI003392814D
MPELQAIRLLLLRMPMAGMALAVCQPLRLLLDSTPAGLLLALQLIPALLFFDLPRGLVLAFAEQLHCRPMCGGQRPRLVQMTRPPDTFGTQ